jgi:hypothetical protein
MYNASRTAHQFSVLIARCIHRSTTAMSSATT